MKRIKNNVLLVTGLLALLGINSCIENCQGVKSIHFGEVKLEQPSLDFIPEIYTHVAVNFVKKVESPLDSLSLA